jgi:hypothetical protein
MLYGQVHDKERDRHAEQLHTKNLDSNQFSANCEPFPLLSARSLWCHQRCLGSRGRGQARSGLRWESAAALLVQLLSSALVPKSHHHQTTMQRIGVENNLQQQQEQFTNRAENNHQTIHIYTHVHVEGTFEVLSQLGLRRHVLKG